MLFSSTVFLFLFLPITFLVNFLLPNIKLKNLFLVIASLVFYAWGEGELVFLMLFSILMNYFFGLAIDSTNSKKRKQIILSSSIIGNLSILGYYKYANFIIENLNIVFFNWELDNINHTEVTLPMGISFFIFQCISYVIDVYRKDGKAQKNILDLALYISLFPQLIAGPIVRYQDVFEQIESRFINIDTIAFGIKRFILGLAKKVLIANTFGLIADQVFAINNPELSGSVAWLGIICYSFQIFFDFSGYSDMAIGLGKMFGFDFRENFNFPYIAQSIRDFWRRWHISLSTWFRDYLYVPLGGNRKGKYRTFLNLSIVFFLTGLWHGASWNFIVWGMIHGLFLILEKIGLEKILSRLPKIVSHIYVLFTVVIAWVFFRSSDLESSLVSISKLFGFLQPQHTPYSIPLFLNNEVIIVFIIAIVSSMPVLKFIKSKLSLSFKQNLIWSHLNNLSLLTLLGLSIMSIASGTHNPFIYFRF